MLLLQLVTVILAAVLLIRSVNHDRRISKVEVSLKHFIKEVNRNRSYIDDATSSEMYAKALSMLGNKQEEQNEEQK